MKWRKRTKRGRRFRSHQHQEPLQFDVEAVESRILLATTVEIFAAGATGQEGIELQIDGQSVASFYDLGTGADIGQFNRLSYGTDQDVTASDVQIEFVNDLYDAAAGIDRNVRIDAIAIDGVRYETEATSVYSTGTWESGGIQPGYHQSEYLHSGGYFQYATENTPVQVRARGSEGGEQFRLVIGDSTVATYTTSTSFQTFTYNTNEHVSPNDVRVEFFGDQYDPSQNIDTNLIVDYLQIRDTVFQTEASPTFSTGTWISGQGIQPGYHQSETLNSDGYFQFGQSLVAITMRAKGDVGGEQFNLILDGETVWTYTVGDSFQTFNYLAPTSLTADQVRIEFINDTYDQEQGIDSNLTLDYITVGGTRYETEASTTFSTGTWTASDGISAGYGRGDTLNSNGYFQFLANPESAGFVGLGQTQVTVDEDAGQVAVEVVRFGGSAGPARVYFQTVASEATAGVDYVATSSGQVDFADGQTTAFAVVSLIDDNSLEQTETFSISLYRAEGAELNVPRTAIVTIVDDESGLGLIGHWKLDESSIGQTVIDASGNNNHGTHNNFESPFGPTTDRPDTETTNLRGVNFDGQGDFISIPENPNLNLQGSSFTQSVWIRPELTDNSFHGVVGRQPELNIERYPSIWVYQKNRIHAGFGDGENWNRFTTSAVLTPGAWNHVATTFDGTTYKAYANGVEVYSSNQWAGRTPYSTTGLTIGELDNSFKGGIDDVQIYNRALSGTEIEVLIDGATVPNIPINGGEFVTSELASGFDTPIEIEVLPDGRLLVAEQDGLVRIVNTNGTVQSTPLLDIRSIVNAGTKDRGMIGFAVHPDFSSNLYIYASFTYDPPETAGLSGLAGPDGNGARASRISRFTVNAAGTYADPNSEFVLVGNNSTWDNIGDPAIRPGLNDPHSCIEANGDPTHDCIPADETSHTIGELEFGADGMLYLASGDGGSFGRVDPVNLRALDVDSLSGKILRIDPITGNAPSDNPLFDGNASSNQSKVFAYGVRNPFRFALNDDANNPTIYIGDVGWSRWEEINVGTGGENFGWPAFEGGDGQNEPTSGYQNLAEVQDYYATNPDVTAPAWARLHTDGARAIVMGDFVSSDYQSIHSGTLLFTDIGDQVLRAARFSANNEVLSVQTVSQDLGFIVDLETASDGFMYYVDITGSVGRLEIEGAAQATVAATAATGAPVVGTPNFVAAGTPVVALIDTRIDLSHTRLATSAWTNRLEIAGDGIDNDGNGYVDDIHGFDFVDQDADSSDGHGHGTFTASVIGATQGVAVMALRALDDNGQGDAAAIAEAIRYAVDQSVDVIALPLQVGPSGAVSDALVYAAQHDVLVVAAAGNDGWSSPSFIGARSSTLENVLSVGAIGSDGLLLPSSNRAGHGGAIQIDAAGTQFGALPNGLYGTFQGTSVATARVASAAALVKSHATDLTSEEVREILTRTATASETGSAGELNIAAALELAQKPEVRFIPRWRRGELTRLTILDTAQDDEIHVDLEAGRVIANGRIHDFDPLTRITIQAKQGADKLTLSATTADETVSWNSRLMKYGLTTQRSRGAQVLARGITAAVVNGGGGQDRIQLSGSRSGDRIATRGDRIAMATDTARISATQFEKIDVRGGGGEDRLYRVATSPPVNSSSSNDATNASGNAPLQWSWHSIEFQYWTAEFAFEDLDD